MAINERLIDTEVAAAGNGGAGSGNQEEGLILHLDANDVDSYDGDGTEWVDITNHEYKPATNVSEHFNTVLYTGTGASNPITGVGFQPDLIWVKRRNSTGDNYIVDTVRGNGTSTYKNLASDTTNAEGTTTTNGITNSTIVDGGFTMQGTGVRTNADDSTYVAWCFKAGGAAVSNTDGSITSSVSANNDLGFSIVSYTGTGSTGDTFGHGLDVPVEMVIVKNRDTSGTSWVVSLKDRTGYLKLNDTNALSGSNFFDMSSSSVLELESTGSWANTNGDDYIAYCFASKRGVSKVGSYEGTGTSGNKIYTGFEPAWIMTKRTNGDQDWWIVDNKTSTSSGEFNKYLEANTDLATFTPGANINIHRDGFSFDGVSFNNSGDSFIYLAFAKDTNFDDLIDDTDLELHLDAASYSGSGSTWTADTGSDATISGASYDEELGDYFDFDGNDSISIPSDSNLQMSSNLTHEVWAKIDSFPSGSTAPVLMGQCSDDGANINFMLWASNGTLYAYLYNTSGGFLSALYDFTPNTGKWMHLAQTYDGSTHNFYVDGELFKTASVTGSVRTNSYKTFLGSKGSAAGNYLDGQIGQARIYSTALSQDQIRQNYNFTKNDYPNGYNGTITGATWNSSGYFNFDGTDDKIDLTGTISLTERSISMWVKFDTLPAASTDFMMLFDGGSHYSTTNTFGSWGVRIRDSAIEAVSNKHNGTNYSGIFINYTVVANQWYHIVVTSSNTTGTILYINNVAYNTSSSAMYDQDRTIGEVTLNTVNLGRKRDIGTGSLFYLDGNISNVKVYDKTLTQAEITALYNEGE